MTNTQLQLFLDLCNYEIIDLKSYALTVFISPGTLIPNNTFDYFSEDLNIINDKSFTLSLIRNDDNYRLLSDLFHYEGNRLVINDDINTIIGDHLVFRYRNHSKGIFFYPKYPFNNSYIYFFNSFVNFFKS